MKRLIGCCRSESAYLSEGRKQRRSEKNRNLPVRRSRGKRHSRDGIVEWKKKGLWRAWQRTTGIAAFRLTKWFASKKVCPSRHFLSRCFLALSVSIARHCQYNSHIATYHLQRQSKMASMASGPTHPFTCNTCQVAFRSSDLQRTHMQSDWQ